jgi:hypothetical protein
LASASLSGSTDFGRKSSRGTADACPGSGGSTLFGNRYGIEFSGKGLKLFAGQRAEEGLHQHFRFAQAGGEIIVQTFQFVPAIAGLHGDACGDVFGGIIIFTRQAL